MASLSPTKDDRCLAFIHEFIAENGFPPSVREIGASIGVRSSATIHQRIKRLEREGRIVATRGRQRTLTLVVIDGNAAPVISLDQERVS